MSANPYEAPTSSSAASTTSIGPPDKRPSTALAVVRSVVGVILGLVAAAVIIALLEAVGHAIYPPPPGIDLYDPEALKSIIDQLPLGAIVMVLVAWGAGTFVGGFTAGAIAGRAQVIHGMIVGGIEMACAVITMILIPHPVWFMIASVFVVLVPALVGALLAKALFDRSGPAGPKPYDMREKNMAC